MNQAMGPDERDTMSDDDRRLAVLLASVEAEANPAVWARVRTRLAAKDEPATARTPLDAFLDWLTRPAALAAATATLVVVLGTGFSLLGTITQTAAIVEAEQLVASDAMNLMESLLEDAEAAESRTDEADESTAPGDSGGRS